MSNEINLLDPKIVSTIIREIEASEDKARKRHAFRDWQIYSGNSDPYILELLRSVRPKTYKTYTRSNISVSRLVTDKLSKAYKQQPKRTVGGDETKDARLMDIYREAGAHKQLPFADTVNNLHKYNLMWVNYIEEDEKYQFMALQPHEYSVVRDKNTGELTAVILNYGNMDITSGAFAGDGYDNLIADGQGDSSAQSRVYAMWSKDNHVIIRVTEATVHGTGGEQVQRSITYVEIKDNPLNENKIGIIPFVYVAKELTVDYPTPNPLGEQTVRYNYMMTEALGAATVQVGQMVIKYPERMQGEFDRMPSSLTSVIELPQSSEEGDSDTSVDYIKPDPNLESQKSLYLTYLRQILAEHGLESGSSLSENVQNFASGLERVIANASVQDIVQKNQESYVEMEQKMFEIIKAIEEFKGRSVFKKDDELQVVFQKPKILISDAETLANIEKRLSLGLMEKYEALIELDPNLTKDEAKQKLQDIDDSRMMKLGATIGGTQGNIQDDQSQSEQGTR
jgi:hypothetical protein